MKFEEMYIEANASEKPFVCDVLNKLGLEPREQLFEIYQSLNAYISTYADGTYSTYPDLCIEEQYVSFGDFMKRYSKIIENSKMIELINKAKSELKMNDSELSLAIGKSRQYIGKMLRLPQSKKVQDKVIKEISEFMDKVKNQVVEKEINISGVLVPNKIQDVLVGQANELDEKDKEIANLKLKNHQANKDISILKKANEQQKLVIDKLDDQLIKAEKIHNEDVKAIELKDKEIHYLNERRIEYKEASIKKQRLVDSLTKENGLLTGELEHSKRETDYFVNQFKRVEGELKELKSSHTTSKALNWFFVVAIILAAIIWKAYNG